MSKSKYETDQPLLPGHYWNHSLRHAHPPFYVHRPTTRKFSHSDRYTYNIAIYGNRADAAMLAYFIDKKVANLGWAAQDFHFNITMIEPPRIDDEEEGRE